MQNFRCPLGTTLLSKESQEVNIQESLNCQSQSSISTLQIEHTQHQSKFMEDLSLREQNLKMQINQADTSYMLDNAGSSGLISQIYKINCVEQQEQEAKNNDTVEQVGAVTPVIQSATPLSETEDIEISIDEELDQQQNTFSQLDLGPSKEHEVNLEIKEMRKYIDEHQTVKKVNPTSDDKLTDEIAKSSIKDSKEEIETLKTHEEGQHSVKKCLFEDAGNDYKENVDTDSNGKENITLPNPYPTNYRLGDTIPDDTLSIILGSLKDHKNSILPDDFADQITDIALKYKPSPVSDTLIKNRLEDFKTKCSRALIDFVPEISTTEGEKRIRSLFIEQCLRDGLKQTTIDSYVLAIFGKNKFSYIKSYAAYVRKYYSSDLRDLSHFFVNQGYPPSMTIGGISLHNAPPKIPDPSDYLSFDNKERQWTKNSQYSAANAIIKFLTTMELFKTRFANIPPEVAVYYESYHQHITNIKQNISNRLLPMYTNIKTDRKNNVERNENKLEMKTMESVHREIIKVHNEIIPKLVETYKNEKDAKKINDLGHILAFLIPTFNGQRAQVAHLMTNYDWMSVKSMNDENEDSDVFISVVSQGKTKHPIRIRMSKEIRQLGVYYDTQKREILKTKNPELLKDDKPFLIDVIQRVSIDRRNLLNKKCISSLFKHKISEYR